MPPAFNLSQDQTLQFNLLRSQNTDKDFLFILSYKPFPLFAFFCELPFSYFCLSITVAHTCHLSFFNLFSRLLRAFCLSRQRRIEIMPSLSPTCQLLSLSFLYFFIFFYLFCCFSLFSPLFEAFSIFLGFSLFFIPFEAFISFGAIFSKGMLFLLLSLFYFFGIFPHFLNVYGG